MSNDPLDARAQPLIAVRSVEASSRWYQMLLGLPSGHGGAEYDRIGSGDDFVMQLHDWHADEHEFLGDEADPSRGNGVLLWFRVDDFDGAVERAGDLGSEVLDGPLVNPNAQQREIWLRDPDGYTVVVAGMPGDLGHDATAVAAGTSRSNDRTSTVEPLDLGALAAAATLNSRGTPVARMDGYEMGVSRFSHHPRWEIHPGGDELLIGIAGDLELTLLLDAGPTTTILRQGQAIVIPTNTWHSPVPLGETSVLSMANYDGTEVSELDDPRATA